MIDSLTIYYDYTCPYSYRVLGWLGDVQRGGRELAVQWNTFALKEVNRPRGAASVFGQTQGESLSILLLELAKAAQAAGPDIFERYHTRVFQVMQEGHRLTMQDVQHITQHAGLALEVFQAERERGVWLQQVAADHREAAERWQAFGTPTLVFNEQAAVYLKFREVPPSPTDAAEVFDALQCLARYHPELVELKHPGAV